MSPSLAQRHAFIGVMIQSAAADFLASFSELLRASSLLERRPEAAHANPDVDQSIKKAKWLLAAAIETRKAIDRIDAGPKNLGSQELAIELQAALSAFADNLIKGQYVAYVNRAAPR
jgi:hypothetical protein